MRKSLFLLILLSAAVPLCAGTIVDEILARVGNEIITRSEYEREIARMRDELSRRFQGAELEQNFELAKKDLLEFMINQKLLEQKARDLDLRVEDDVNGAVQKLREENDIPDDQTLEAMLRKEGTSLAQLREDFRRRIVQQKILWNYVQSKVNITEEEIRNYYDQHRSEITTEPRTTVRRYLLSDEQTDKDTLQAEALAALQDLRSGKDLQTGDLPHLKVEEAAEFGDTELNPQFVQAIKNIPAGSFSEPLQVPAGWIILKVEGRSETQEVPFEDARGRIYNILLSERAESYQKAFLEDLRKQSYVVVNQPSS